MPLQFNRSLSALSFICAADSSPEMYRILPGKFCAIFDAACINKVDFPIPGSPPIITADRFVAPPPRTRSNSSIPVVNLDVSCALIDSNGTGFAFSLTELPLPAGETAELSTIHSSMLFHSPHSGHRPNQRGCV